MNAHLNGNTTPVQRSKWQLNSRVLPIRAIVTGQNATLRHDGHMIRSIITATLLLWGSTVHAETQMSPEEFEAYVEGKTLYFASEGDTPYGAEQYRSNRRVRWSYLDGECKEGQWFVDLDLICFVYQDDPEPQCWSFYRTARGLKALFENDPDQTVLYEVSEASGPLQCYGPEVGA